MDHEPEYYECDIDTGEPDPDAWIEQQARQEWAAASWWRRLGWCVAGWWHARRRARHWRRAHRRVHPGISKRDCPDPWHGVEPPF